MIKTIRKSIQLAPNTLFFLLSIFIYTLFQSVATGASDHVKGRNVEVSLVSDWSQRQGDQFHAAIVFDINDNWHTYWKNPGTTGMATTVNWELPDGFEIEAVYYSIPQRYNNEGLVDYIYEDQAMVVASVRASAHLDAREMPPIIRATVNWLECSTLCVPGNGELELALNRTTAIDAATAEAIARISAKYHDVQPGRYNIHNNILTLELNLQDIDASQYEHYYFFPETAINDAAASQEHVIQGNSLVIKTATAPFIEQPSGSISGWLLPSSAQVDGSAIRFEMTPTSTLSPGLSTGSVEVRSNFLLLLALALAGGLILNLMPCVFPVIGLKIMGFVEQAGQDRKKIVYHGLIFTSGVLVSFWLLSGLLLLLRAGGQQLGWGFQLQEPLFNYALILLMLAFALSLNGVFEFGMSAMGVGSGLQQKSGALGSFFSGVLATVVATPCSAPFLAPALGAALALQPWQAMILFTCIALGLSTPYLLLSIFPGVLKLLPKPGAWMETFKQFMAFPLYGTVAYLLWALLGQIDDSNQLNLLLSLALFAMAFWIFGRWGAPFRKQRTRRIAIVASILTLLLSILLGYPRQKREFWQPWSPEAVEQYVADGKTVYVDFTARWCATCQLNKRVVFGSEEVVSYFEDNNIIALKADWTNRDERITRRLKSLGKAAVPVNLVYKNGENEPIILPEVLTPGIVLEALSAN